MDSECGLYTKYDVTKIKTGEVVHNCFVLRPEKDPHARAALLAYAESVEADNPQLAGDLWLWMADVARRERWAEQKEDQP